MASQITQSTIAHFAPAQICLFYPFDEPIVMNVLAKLRDSLETHLRQLSRIYALPKNRRDPLVDLPWLILRHERETIDSDWQRLAIYETR